MRAFDFDIVPFGVCPNASLVFVMSVLCLVSLCMSTLPFSPIPAPSVSALSVHFQLILAIYRIAISVENQKGTNPAFMWYLS